MTIHVHSTGSPAILVTDIEQFHSTGYSGNEVREVRVKGRQSMG
jgi:hypothetical protein